MSPPWPGRRPRPAPIWSPSWRHRSRRAARRRSIAGRCPRGPSASRPSTRPAGSTPRGGASACWRIWRPGCPARRSSRWTPAPAGGRASAWPLDPALHAFLARRNRILTAFRSLPADRLGVELARVTVEALRAATAASGLTGDQFRFGGGWGAAEGALARLLRPGADGASYLADHFGTLAPLLALDSALDELPRLLEIRKPAAGARGRARGRVRGRARGAARGGVAGTATGPRSSSSPGTAGSTSARACRRSPPATIPPIGWRSSSSTTARPTGPSSGSRASIPGSASSRSPRTRASPAATRPASPPRPATCWCSSTTTCGSSRTPCAVSSPPPPTARPAPPPASSAGTAARSTSCAARSASRRAASRTTTASR